MLPLDGQQHGSFHPVLRYHGDQAVEPGMLDFAVNVRLAEPPRWLQDRLTARLTDLASYPTKVDEERARNAVAARHHRRPDDVLLLSGAAEGFALLANLGSKHAAVVQPSFTEPEHVLREAGVRVSPVVCDEGFGLELTSIPTDADLFVVGNPTNPTSVLHPRETILTARAPGRVVVVDEAFADAEADEPESLARHACDDVIVLRSLTKTWALAGLRCGYLLASPELVKRLESRRPHWPLGTLQLEAIYQCSQPGAVAEAAAKAADMRADRDHFINQLTELGLRVTEPARAPFLLVSVPRAEEVRDRLARDHRIAVRRCDTFPSLGPDYLRLAVRTRPDIDRLISVLRELL
ncbi:Rv2231c family pyridoxal phosphate-dependent protein CobC [Smaragdicoccus niigatensis]